jgi:hypothetical protein
LIGFLYLFLDALSQHTQDSEHPGDAPKAESVPTVVTGMLNRFYRLIAQSIDEAVQSL